jgi:hypothetical protein
MNQAIKCSYPYVTGMGLRNRCHLIYDEFQKDSANKITQHNQVVFVKADFIYDFFINIAKDIRFKFKLITHNSDLSINENHATLLNYSNLIRWYAQNVDIYHPKLTSIPIGIANARWGHGNISALKEVESLHTQKTNLLYCNFDSSTNQANRSQLYNQFANQDFAHVSQRKTFREYLTDVKSSRYVLSPAGNGIDCHRLWETLLMRSIPVVENSINISFYKHLPILIADDWRQVNEQFLREKLHQLQNTTPQECYLDYWIKKIGLKNIKNTA